MLNPTMDKHYFISKLQEITHVLQLVNIHLTPEEAIEHIALITLRTSELTPSPSVLFMFKNDEQAATFYNLFLHQLCNDYDLRRRFARADVIPTGEEVADFFGYHPESRSIIGYLASDSPLPFGK